MRQVMRPFIMTAAALLPVLTGSAAAHATPSETERAQTDAPACVEVGADWRYTFVTNTCSSTYTLTVAYSDGREVPCRVVHPGDRVTFPGHGTRGDRVLGAVLCSGGTGH
ncbi:alpha-amylase [Streptomyces viridosporus]|uniref:alpha-amylase n=1 Tax=Streptomyces viridosporus TaxID=67581 RepID=UPI0021006109|nr:alpha-amylase [Streptomyces viridosporus]